MLCAYGGQTLPEKLFGMHLWMTRSRQRRIWTSQRHRCAQGEFGVSQVRGRWERYLLHRLTL